MSVEAVAETPAPEEPASEEPAPEMDISAELAELNSGPKRCSPECSTVSARRTTARSRGRDAPENRPSPTRG